jgi:hypothetical protein
VNLTTKQLLNRLHFDRAYTEAARIIGYGGIEMSAFWKQAKTLGIPHNKLLSAVYDLTRTDKREEKPPRYELRGDIRDLCWQLLGPAPEQEEAFWRHPDGLPMERPKKDDEMEQAQGEPEKKPKTRRGQGAVTGWKAARGLRGKHFSPHLTDVRQVRLLDRDKQW